MRGVFIFITGITIGLMISFWSKEAPIKPVPEINPGVATILITDIQDTTLKGKVVGTGARIAYSAEKITTVEPGSIFTVPLNQVNLGSFFAHEQIPEGALWIASASGKNAYSVFDKRAYRIKAENRLYFSSESQAKKAGYKISPP